MTIADQENKFVESFAFEPSGKPRANIAIVPDYEENRIYFVPDGASAPAMIALDVLDAEAWWAEHNMQAVDRPGLNLPVDALVELGRTIAGDVTRSFKPMQLLAEKARAAGPRGPCHLSKASKAAGYGWAVYWYNKVIRPMKKARLGTIPTTVKGMQMLIAKGQTVWTVVAPRHLESPAPKKTRLKKVR